MALSFGTLVFVSVGGVLALSVGANFRNTLDLLGAQSSLLVDAMEDALRAEMGNAESAVEGVAELYAQGDFRIDDAAMPATVAGALAAAPGTTAMLICTPDLVCRATAHETDDNAADTIQHFPAEPEKSPQVRAALEQRRLIEGKQWGAIVANEFGLFAHVSMPLIRDGATGGWVIAAVKLQKLSEITQELSARFGTHAFILDGEDKVLADQRLADPQAPQHGIVPLMPAAQFGDPVIAAYGSRRPEEEFNNERFRDVEVAEVELGGDEDTWSDGNTYVVISRKITGYGDRPWTLGAYFRASDVADELQRVLASALLGLGALICAVLVAVLLGRRLSRPIRAIADQASRIADFDLDGIAPLPPSRVREIDNQATAFNAMLIGLRAFSTYIPRSLVAKLVRTGEIGVAEPRAASVTVMFTDIAAFTTLSEHMSAAEIARALNHHFEILCRAVDVEGGTVDKFLGDGMMAFFGAPDRLEGHAAAAVRAAAAIRDELEEDNRKAPAEGRPPLRIRIGIHTGPVIVGNIGAADRVNYTIIGDTVNVSQRLQGLAKELVPEETVAIVISGETAARLDERFMITPAGEHRLRGRGEATEVYLVEGIAPAAPVSQTARAG